MQKSKASILVVTLMVLGIVLVSALSISLVSVQERKASMGSSKSGAAFQVADSGIELVMDSILSSRKDSLKTLASIGCSNGNITGTGYVVELKKDNGSGGEVGVNCGTDKISDIIAIKSVGTGGGQQRAIEAAVASNSYDVSITRNATTWVMCRVDTSSGFVDCKNSTNGTTWNGGWTLPWTVSTGSYKIWIAASGSSGWQVCRINTSSANTDCRFTTDGTTWTTVAWSSPW